jgi:4-diphosphocytidyl-2-C-methyl-D-erythritol kinase
MTVVRATAFAKLTLSLRVLGRRPDGFHDIEALTASIGQPHDTLAVRAGDRPGVRFELETDDADDVPATRTNLAVRAVEVILAAAGRDDGVDLTLSKRIPAGAGLGGGSADAAAALVVTRQLLDLDVDDASMVALAATLGSDVPFCLYGGAAWMRGRGELVEPVELARGIPMLLAVPPFRLSTPAVYRMWDELGGPRSDRPVPAPPPIATVQAELANDLEPAAERLEPALREFRERFERAAGRPALLAGSGSSLVVPVDDARALPVLADRVTAGLGWPVVPAATVSRGVRVERPEA